MIILAISILSSLGIFAISNAFLGLVPSVFPALVVLAVVYFIASKKIATKLEAVMMSVQKEIQSNRLASAINMLKQIKQKYGSWQFFTKSSINGQIGSIYYLQKKYDQAKPYLQKSFVRHWVAKAMLAILYFRKKDYKNMDKEFERATKYSSKQGLLWSTWAFCYHKLGKNAKAIEILSNGKKYLKDSDKILAQNLLNLQNKKKMKMRGYGDVWYQLYLEMPPQMRQQQNKVRFVRR